MADLPSGTVTFLVTDIEGSSALGKRDAVATHTVVLRHDALLVDAVAANRGVLEPPVGDAVESACSMTVATLPAAVAAECPGTAAAGVSMRPVPTAQG
jgi:class 3 adenylate cyclase